MRALKCQVIAYAVALVAAIPLSIVLIRMFAIMGSVYV